MRAWLLAATFRKLQLNQLHAPSVPINVVIDVKSTNLAHFSSLNNPFRDVAAKNVSVFD